MPDKITEFNIWLVFREPMQCQAFEMFQVKRSSLLFEYIVFIYFSVLILVHPAVYSSIVVILSVLFSLLIGAMVVGLKTWLAVNNTEKNNTELYLPQLESIWILGTTCVHSLLVYLEVTNEGTVEKFCGQTLQPTNKLSDNVLITAVMLPLVFAFAAKGARWKYIIASWLTAAVVDIGVLVRQNAYLSIPSIIQWIALVFLTLYENQRQNMSVFVLAQRQQRLIDENARMADEIQANELRHMISNVAHDLKTPLCAFMSGLEVMSDAISEIQRIIAALTLNSSILDKFDSMINVVLSTLHSIKSTNSFMTMTINRCIDYTKTSRGLKLMPKQDTVNFLDVINLSLYCMKSLQSRVQLVMLPMKVEDGICPYIITDVQWLQENLLCLLSNAVKYSSKGCVTISVSLIENNDATTNCGLCTTTRNSSSSGVASDFCSSNSVNAFNYLLAKTNSTDYTKITMKEEDESSSINRDNKARIHQSNNNVNKDRSEQQHCALLECDDASRLEVAADSVSESKINASPDNTDNIIDSCNTNRYNDNTNSSVIASSIGSSSTYSSVVSNYSIGSVCSHNRRSDEGRKVSFSSVLVNADGRIDATTTDVLPDITQNLIEKMLRIEVEDTGIGLSEEEMKKLFNPFKQAQRMAGGTGLGLFSLAKRVEALQGQYGVMNRRDGQQGSLFWFTIPYRPDITAAESTVTNNSSSSSQSRATTAAGKSLPPIFEGFTAWDPNNSFSSIRREPGIIGDNIVTTCNSNNHSNYEKSSQLSENKNLSDKDIDTMACTKVVTLADLTVPLSPSLPVGELPILPPSVPVPPCALIVDDSMPIQKMTSMLLKSKGYHTSTAENGSDALDKILAHKRRNEPYDVVLMDFQMPVMDGLEATRRLRGIEKHQQGEELMRMERRSMEPKTVAPCNEDGLENLFNEEINQQIQCQQNHHHQLIIGVSANSDDETMREGFAAGMDAFISKPFTWQTFLTTYDKMKLSMA